MSGLRALGAIALLFSLVSPGRAGDVDVCIYGGTPAGIIAAVTAAREGARAVVIEPTRWIGGMVTGGLTHTDIGNAATIGGYTREFFTRAAERYRGEFFWYAAPHANTETFEAMLAEAKVGVVRGQRLAAVVCRNGRIESLTTDDGQTYAARMFIDATYEGDLMARAGVRYRVGRESLEEYGEPLAGFHPMPIRPRTAEVMASVCPCLGGQGPHYIHGTPLAIPARDEKGQLLFGVREDHTAPGAADRLTQAYNFRVVVTQRADLRVPFPRPAHYEPARYELLLRLIRAYPVVRFGRLFHLGQVAEGKYDLNAQGIFSTDCPGGNTDYPDGDYATRDRIWQDHVDFIQGMFWFLGHDPRVPQALRDETNQWGLCRDEFTDNAHWPYALYVREGRRMVGQYVLVQKDLQREITKPDSVGMGSFVIDCHIVQRIVGPDGNVLDEGSFQDAPARPYHIPYRSITPKPSECQNLLVPVCASASHIAYCSLRMEPVYMALGQAAGLAAVKALRGGTSVQAIDVPALQSQLRAQKAVLELKGLGPMRLASSLPGIVCDDHDAEFTGDWSNTNFGDPLEGAARHDANFDKGKKSARFTLRVPTAGQYEVRFAFGAAATNRASNVPVRIEHADGTAQRVVNERQPPTIDKWFVPLGVYRFTPERPAVVLVENAGTDGYVSVDAVQLVPVPGR